MLTRREIIQEAYTEIGLGITSYSLQDADWDSANKRLNAMLAEWSGMGAQGGYEIGGLDDPAGVPPDGENGVICGLAVVLAPSFGKSPLPDTVAGARRGKQLMLRKSACIPQIRTDYADIPSGAGVRSERINLEPDDPNICEDDCW